MFKGFQVDKLFAFYLGRPVMESFGQKFGLDYGTVRNRIMNEREKWADAKKCRMKRMGME